MNLPRRLAALALAATATVGTAQERGRGPAAADPIGRLAERLDLSDAQRDELRALRDERAADRDALREASPEERRARARRTRERLRAVLTAEQLARLRELREDRIERRGDLRDALAAYRRAEVAPALRRLRSAFDDELSAGEREAVDRFRVAVRERFGDAGLGELAGRPPARHRHPRGVDSVAGAFLREHRAELDAVRRVARAHDGELRAVREEIRGLRDRWRADTEDIRRAHLTERQPARRAAFESRRTERGRPDRRRGRADRARPAGAGLPSPAERGAILFLLLDPADVDAGIDAADGLGDAGPWAFPNPADEATSVTFEVRVAGPVRVELLDAGGRVARTLDEGRREAGEVTLPVRLPGDLGATAVVRVTDALGTRTVVVARG